MRYNELGNDERSNEKIISDSKVIFAFCAGVLYICFILWVAGGFAAALFVPIGTILFLLVAVLVYYPSIFCIRLFLNKQKSKPLRYFIAFLLLVPYFLSCGYCIYKYVDEHITNSDSAIESRAIEDLPELKKIYRNNAELINKINDTILNKNRPGYDWCIGYIRYHFGSVDVSKYSVLSKSFYPGDSISLDEFQGINFEEKQDILKLVNIFKESDIIRFEQDEITFPYQSNVYIRFTTHPLKQSAEKLDDKWYIETVTYQHG